MCFERDTGGLVVEGEFNVFLERLWGSANLTNLYFEQFLASGIFWSRLRIVGLEYPKNSGPDPELVACLSLHVNIQMSA